MLRNKKWKIILEFGRAYVAILAKHSYSKTQLIMSLVTCREKLYIFYNNVNVIQDITDLKKTLTEIKNYIKYFNL